MYRDLFDLEGAACAGHPQPDIFFERVMFHTARRVCRECPVKAPCWLTAVRYSLLGTWGGVWFSKGSEGRIRRPLAVAEISREARRYLLQEYGILVKDGNRIESRIREAVRSRIG